MPYQDSITQNLALFCSPGLSITLIRLGRRVALFRITGKDHSFCLACNRPAIFALANNAPQVSRLFREAYQIRAHR